MSEPHALVPPGKPGDGSAPAIEHGVAAPDHQLWPFSDIPFEVDGEQITGSAIIDYRFMDGTNAQRDAVRSTIHSRRKPPGVNFDTWEDFANIRFRESRGIAQVSQIRITFAATDSQVPVEFHSVIGTDVQGVPANRATMWLAGLPSVNPPEEESRGSILHEFGHVLGLRHEHQSPDAYALDENTVLADFRGNEKWAKDNIVNKFADSMNYTKFDENSIMVYHIWEYWQKRSWRHLTLKEIHKNYKLSELDKAFVQLIYPPDLNIPGKGDLFRDAMVKAGIPRKHAGAMLGDFMRDDRSLAERLKSIRNRFNRLKNDWWSLWNSKLNRQMMYGIDGASLKQFGVDGFMEDVTSNKLFQGIVKNLVHQTMEQHGIQARVPLPGSTQYQTTKMLAAFAMQDDLGHHINHYINQLSDTSTNSRIQNDNVTEEVLQAQPIP